MCFASINLIVDDYVLFYFELIFNFYLSEDVITILKKKEEEEEGKKLNCNTRMTISFAIASTIEVSNLYFRIRPREPNFLYRRTYSTFNRIEGLSVGEKSPPIPRNG